MTADEIRKQARELSTTISDMCKREGDPAATARAVELGNGVSVSAAAWELAAQLAELNDTLARLVDVIHDKP